MSVRTTSRPAVSYVKAVLTQPTVVVARRSLPAWYGKGRHPCRSASSALPCVDGSATFGAAVQSRMRAFDSKSRLQSPVKRATTLPLLPRPVARLSPNPFSDPQCGRRLKRPICC